MFINVSYSEYVLIIIDSILVELHGKEYEIRNKIIPSKIKYYILLIKIGSMCNL